jgi:putative oxidoreductase
MERQWRRFAYVVTVWALTVVVAAGLGFAGIAKFLNPHQWEHLFTGWGYPAWFSPAIGTIEMAGAVALLVPRLALYSAILLGAVMLGALVTLLRHPTGPLGSGATPLFYLALLGIISIARWRARTAAAFLGN